MDPLMVLMRTRLRDFSLKFHWDLLMVYLGPTYVTVCGSDVDTKLISTNAEVTVTTIVNTSSIRNT